MDQAWSRARSALEEEGWDFSAFDRPLVWPFEPRAVGVGKVRGTLFGVAVGDALGAPNEGEPRGKLRERRLERLAPHNGLPAGAVTDDTQLTLALMESLLARGTLDPEDLVRRFVALAPSLVAAGWATRQALERLARGAAWWLAGSASAGNGAAMRVAPVGLLLEGPDVQRRAALLQAIVTHRDRTAAAAAVANALIVGWLARGGPPSVAMLDWAANALEGFEVPLAGRSPRKQASTVAARLREVAAFDGELDEALERFGTGAFVLESLPSALFIFMRYADEPERALLEAAHAGGDTDTIASLVGGWLGAYLGDRGLRSGTPSNWWDVSVAAEIERLSRPGLRL